MDNIEISKLDMKSKDIIKENVEKIGNIFPNVIVESQNGKAIDFELLKQELSNQIVESNKERYQLTWSGKRKSGFSTNIPTTKTLRPLKEKSLDFDNTKNIYIEGDNLEALKILQESYLNKIKCIYIDPPYNTGRNLIYKNDYSKSVYDELKDSGQINEQNDKLTTNPVSNGRFHSDWLSMIYSRIKIARRLLSQDGVLICAIDENEVNTLGIILQEIFNTELYCISIIHNPRGIQGINFSFTHEYAYFVFKNSGKRIGNRKISDKEIDFRNLRDNGSQSLRTDAKNCFYPIIVEDNNIVGFGEVLTDLNIHPKQNEKINNQIYIYPIDKNGIERKWRYARQSIDEIKDMLKVNIKNNKYEILLGKNFGTYRTVWTDARYDSNEYGKKLLNNLVPNNPFDFPKSLNTVLDCIYAVVEKDKNAIILDFFSGSATTAHAIMELNASDNGKRKFIMVQYPEEGNKHYKTICDVAQTRIKNAGKKIKEETNADIDYGFRVYKIDSSNMKDIYYKPTQIQQNQLNMFEANIKQDRTQEDLLTQVILDLGLTLDLQIQEKNILENKVYFVDKNSLIACFDDKINIDIINEICKTNPQRIVFKESSFTSDKDKINIYEKIRKLSSKTQISII